MIIFYSIPYHVLYLGQNHLRFLSEVIENNCYVLLISFRFIFVVVVVGDYFIFLMVVVVPVDHFHRIIRFSSSLLLGWVVYVRRIILFRRLFSSGFCLSPLRDFLIDPFYFYARSSTPQQQPHKKSIQRSQQRYGINLAIILL